MNKIILASNNPGKISEMVHMFPKEWGIDLIPQSQLCIQDAEETASTFVENALIKARHAAKLSGLPAIADDSGLCIDYLDGAPGVFSSRYAGPHASNEDRIKKVLDAMKEVPTHLRTARFISIIAFMRNANDPDPVIFSGTWDGYILTAPQGDKGFGYDPIFYISSHGCSAAELDTQEKNRISHRGQSMAQLYTWVNTNLHPLAQ